MEIFIPQFESAGWSDHVARVSPPFSVAFALLPAPDTQGRKARAETPSDKAEAR